LVSTVLGHSSVAITGDLYCGIDEKDVRAGLDDLYAAG
jgi:hypothetical protein